MTKLTTSFALTVYWIRQTWTDISIQSSSLLPKGIANFRHQENSIVMLATARLVMMGMAAWLMVAVHAMMVAMPGAASVALMLAMVTMRAAIMVIALVTTLTVIL